MHVFFFQTYTYVYMYTFTYIHAYIYIYIYILYKYIYLYTYVCIYAYIYVHTSIYTYIYISICTYLYMFVYICTYVHSNSLPQIPKVAVRKHHKVTTVYSQYAVTRLLLISTNCCTLPHTAALCKTLQRILKLAGREHKQSGSDTRR